MRPVLHALAGHWRRHPAGLAALLVGIALATALWSGVQALNAEARASYDRAAALLGGGQVASVEAAGGGSLPLADFVALRRAGWRVSPLIEGDLAVGGAVLRIVGVEPVTMPAAALPGSGRGGARLVAFMLPPYLGLAAPETIARLGAAPAGLPPLEAAPDTPPDTVVVDIGVAERLLGLTGRISRMLLPADGPTPPLPPAMAGRLVVVPPAERPEVARLSQSFHLNLTAFGLLSFVVGLFIVHAAAGLAFEQRRATFRTLRACGVSARGLTAALAVETLAVTLAGGIAGMLLGYLLAAALLPDMAASLRGLYGARVEGSLSLGPGWWLAGLAMSLGGALVAVGASLWRAATLPLLAPAQPEAWRAAGRRARRWQAAGGLALWLLALGALAGSSLVAGFAVLAGLLVGAALLLPALLAAMIALGARAARHPVAQWIWADARQGIGGLSLALMALLLALAVNIGVGTMVDSFRRTFLGYLDQRLAAEVYVTGRDEAEGQAIATWLQARPEVTAVLPIWNARTSFGGWPLEVYGFRDHATYRGNWPLLAAAPDAWDRIAAGDAVLVSEQFARRQGIGVGDPLTLVTPAGPWMLQVAGVYPDYGNADGQLMAPADAVAAHWPELDRRRMAVRVAPEAAPRLIANLRAHFGLDREVVDQRGLKALSARIFERTFAVTVALNALTLLVAGVAMLASLLGLADARLGQLAPVWALGLTRRRLAAIEVGRAVGLAALTAVAALPLGLALAWVLTAVVNVRAFGWRLPVLILPGHWAATVAVALAAAALAALWPALRLARTPPAALLQQFSNER